MFSFEFQKEDSDQNNLIDFLMRILPETRGICLDSALQSTESSC